MYRHIQACTHTQSYWIPPGHRHTHWLSPTHTHTHTHTHTGSLLHMHTDSLDSSHTHTHWIPPTYTQSLASSYAHTHSLDPSHTHTLTQLVLSRLIWKPLSRALRSPGVSGHPGPPQLRVNWSLVPFSVTSSFTGEPRSRWMRVREGRMHLQGGSCLFREAGGRKSFQGRTFLLFSSFLVPSLIQKPSLNGSFIEKDIFPLLGKCCPLTQRDVYRGGFSSHCFTS